MNKLVVGCAAASVVVVASVGSVAAGQPAAPGCVGESVSANAKDLQPYGGFISAVTPRNDFGSLGDAVHVVQDGAMPDDIYSNTCND